MSKLHILKIYPTYFSDVLSGKKRFEVRINDRDYQVGDFLLLREFNPDTSSFTQRATMVCVVYILPLNGILPTLDSQYVVLGFVPYTWLFAHP